MEYFSQPKLRKDFVMLHKSQTQTSTVELVVETTAMVEEDAVVETALKGKGYSVHVPEYEICW